MVHSVTGMTPYEARKPKNTLDVLQQLEIHAKRNRIYPDIHLGDHVKIYTKKKKYPTKCLNILYYEKINKDKLGLI